MEVKQREKVNVMRIKRNMPIVKMLKVNFKTYQLVKKFHKANISQVNQDSLDMLDVDLLVLVGRLLVEEMLEMLENKVKQLKYL